MRELGVSMMVRERKEKNTVHAIVKARPRLSKQTQASLARVPPVGILIR